MRGTPDPPGTGIAFPSESMTCAQPHTPPHTTLSRSGEQFVGWLRELEECRICGLVTDEDYAFQRAEKFAVLLRPARALWLASALGAALVGATAGTLIWFLTHNQRYAVAIAVIAGAWGCISLGRILREKFSELQVRGRREIFVALLENDLLTAVEFADYDERLARGQEDVA